MYKNIKNHVDFFLRNSLNFSYPLPHDEAQNPRTLKHQNELEEFLDLFSWQGNPPQEKNFVIADVGTRTFSIAPVFERYFRALNPEIHGIEIDAFRRFTNFRSRADYGHLFASTVPNAHYHALDFLKWEKDCHLISMLNPFVTKDPLLNWGLPLSAFKPMELFRHAHHLLKKFDGHLLLSTPTMEEFALAKNFSEKEGFKILEVHSWNPDKSSTQKVPRFGALFKIN